MNYTYLHPRDEIALTLSRIYRYKMTTTSGGNLSILDEHGDIWITPARVDKGSLTAADIVCVKRDGTVVGPHPPSSEFPFHRAVYEARPDIRAVVHAHPMALVAFSISKRVPDTRLIPQTYRWNGQVGFAPYGVPGSEDLGQKIAAKFADGYDSVILENHGVCCGGKTLQDAFQRFETLELCCKTEIKASLLGEPKFLTDAQLQAEGAADMRMEAFDSDPAGMSVREKELRNQLCQFVERGYRQRLLTGSTGSFSARLDADTFLITPRPLDRFSVLPEEIVLIRRGRHESGKNPSHAALAHQAVYAAHPDVCAIINACPLNALAFSVCHRTVDTRTLPECYIFLREVGLLPFETTFNDHAAMVRQLSLRHPAAVLCNNGVMVAGRDILSAFDQLEVLECSAEAILDSLPIGGFVPMGQPVIDEIIQAFHLPA
ncbi:MAG: class II aldolase/adducin family protein [Verrucomicrobiota bacterium]|jgi:L-fuculose-phosphate aldolase|nr:class II aldolase/adducin family protein [Verrucomicrobiota bacterium]